MTTEGNGARDPFSFVTSGSRGWARYYTEQGAPFVRIGDLKRGTLTVDWRNAQRVTPPPGAEGRRTRALPGDILISITADLGVIGVVPNGVPEVFINQHIALARPREGLEPRYVGWFLESAAGGQRQFRDQRRGATKAGLGLDDIRRLNIPAPGLEEQRRVVGALEAQVSRLDAAVASLTRAKNSAATARASVLKAAVAGRLVRAHATSAGPLAAEERLPAGGPVAGLPPGWRVMSVASLADGPPCNGRSVPTRDDGFPVLRLTAMQDGRLDVAEKKGGAWSRAEAEPWLVKEGDFFIMRGNGSLDRVGAAAIAPVVATDVAFPDTMIRLRTKRDVVDPRYLLLAWNSPLVRRQIESSARTTAGIHKINQASLLAYSIPVPPLPEQVAIIAEVDRRLSVLVDLERVADANLARCDSLRQALLKRAFEGTS